MSFTAKTSTNRAIIEWETATEINNAGFNIYRSKGGIAVPQRINTSLIPAQGTSHSGYLYTYVDDNIVPGDRYYYILEDVSTEGAKTLHGPANKGTVLERQKLTAE